VRLSIFSFQGDVEYGFAPVFSICSPGRGNETNGLYGNPLKVQKKFNDMFGQPLLGVLDSLRDPKHADHSPILEVMVDITSRSEFAGISVPRRITIISDMIQNSPILRLFGDGDKHPQPEIASERAGARSFPTFALRVFQIRGRYSEEDLDRAKDFWVSWASLYGITIDWNYL